MRIVQDNWNDRPQGVYTAVALGFFDGVHIGHQAVIRKAVSYAEANGLSPAVFTFTLDSHPGKKGPRLMMPQQKHNALQKLGLAYCFEPPFESFHHLSAEDFFERVLVQQYSAKALFCGENFAFGAGRTGDVQLLKELCAKHGLTLTVMPMAVWGSEPVSSSRIRNALAAGDVASAACMLGRPYEIELPVQRGKSLGSKLGFPTLNQIFPEGMQPPKFGVYVTKTVVDGKAYPSATGYGTRPTVNGTGATCETFIPGFEGNLYDRQVQVGFYDRIADVTRFNSVLELAAAVQHWADEALAYFSQTPDSKNT